MLDNLLTYKHFHTNHTLTVSLFLTSNVLSAKDTSDERLQMATYYKIMSEGPSGKKPLSSVDLKAFNFYLDRLPVVLLALKVYNVLYSSTAVGKLSKDIS